MFKSFYTLYFGVEEEIKLLMSVWKGMRDWVTLASASLEIRFDLLIKLDLIF